MTRPRLMTSPRNALSQITRWWNVTHVPASTWPSVSSIVVMSSLRMWMQPLLLWSLQRLFSLWIGAPLDLRYNLWLTLIKVVTVLLEITNVTLSNYRLASTTNLRQLCQVETLPSWQEQFAASQTQLLSSPLGVAWTRSSIWCMPRGRSFTGMVPLIS